MLQYNVFNGQSDRPIGPVRTPGWIVAGAITGALALHGLVAAVLLVLAASQGGAIEEAAITIFIDPGAPPVATATESAPAPAPAPRPEPPQPEPETAAAPPQAELQDSIPPPEPMESLAPPDFSQPPPPPPPRPRLEPPKQPPPQKVEPKRTPPAAPALTATPAPSPAPAPESAPGTVTPSAPGAGQPAAAPAPGWNALLAAWLAAHRRYPEEARKRSEEGDVTVRFTVAGDGHVSDVAVVKGSGFGALDASALSMLQGATLPVPGVEATRTVRIRFRLSD
jgi:protein TonB